MSEDQPAGTAVLTESSPTREHLHTNSELANVYKSHKIEREWLNNPDWPSSSIIPTLHHSLLGGVKTYDQKGVTPLPPGVYRNIDIESEGEPSNFLVHGLDVRPIMQTYTSDLDKVLTSLDGVTNMHIDQVIAKAAWAYYTYERIHPFLDGNGRVGRMIMKRVLAGGGLRSIIFTEESHGMNRRVEQGRNKHLDALNQVNKSGNLAGLEIFIAQLLADRYSTKTDGEMVRKLENFIADKKSEIKKQKSQKSLAEIWPPFGDIDIDTGEEDNGYQTPK